MIEPREIQFRLRTEIPVTLVRTIGLAADAGESDLKSKTPAIYVLPGRLGDIRDLSDSHRIKQLTQAAVTILVCSAHYRVSREGQVDQLREMRGAVQSALLGYRPANAERAMRFGGGELVAYSAEAIVWADRYTADYLIEALTP